MAESDPLRRETQVTRIRRDQLQSLLEVTRGIVATLDLDELLRRLLDELVRLFQVERGLILLREEGSDELVPRVTRNLRGRSLDEAVDASRRVVASVAQSGRPVLSPDAMEEAHLKALSSVGGQGVRGLVCYPLVRGDQTVGAVYLDSRGAMNYFSATAQALLSTLCNLASIAIANARRHEAVVNENQELRGELRKRQLDESLVGTSQAMRSLVRRIDSVAPLPVTVLIRGESGTGKELVARMVHLRSDRATRRFVAVNCGELPETLVESELFGFRKGAFTGAQADRKGLFEEADQGTLFLDEITNTSPALQAKLLRVLQEGEVKRLGDNLPRKVDVRLVCASNADLETLVRDGGFREDLYYRINVVALSLPALRERREDIPLLADHFLRKYNVRFKKSVRGFSPEARDRLGRHGWPGNVRELENAVQRAVALADGAAIRPEDLDLSTQAAPGPAAGAGSGPLREQVRAFERELIRRSLDAADGNIARAAEGLGMARQQLHRMVRQYGLSTDPGSTE